MNDKELRLIEAIKSEAKDAAERKIKLAKTLFINQIGSASLNGETIEYIISRWDTDQLVTSLADIIYNQTLDTESSAYKRSSSTPEKITKNIQVQLNGKILTHISTSSEEEALADPKVKSHLGDKRIVKTVIVQDKLVNIITE